jgi:hypothetical protein
MTVETLLYLVLVVGVAAATLGMYYWDKDD